MAQSLQGCRTTIVVFTTENVQVIPHSDTHECFRISLLLRVTLRDLAAISPDDAATSYQRMLAALRYLREKPSTPRVSPITSGCKLLASLRILVDLHGILIAGAHSLSVKYL